MFYKIVNSGSPNNSAKSWSWILMSKDFGVIARGENYFNKMECVLAISLSRGTSISTPILDC